MDLAEAEDHYVLKADLPGLSEEDVSIEVEDGVLTVAGERKAEHERSEQGLASHRAFVRQLQPPADAARGRRRRRRHRRVRRAACSNVRIPKPEEVKPRRIAIRPGGNGDGSAPRWRARRRTS